MKNKVWALILVFTVCFAMAIFPVSATNINEQQDKLDDVQQQQSEVSEDLSQVKDQIQEKQEDIDQIQADILKKTNEIAETIIKLEKAENKINKKQDDLNARLRAMYKNGSIGYLDVLFGSDSISKFISNFEMVQCIYKHDVQMLKELKKDYKNIQKQKEELETQRSDLTSKQAQLSIANDELNEKKAILEEKIDELNKTAEEISDKIRQLQDNTAVYSGGKFTWPAPGYYTITSEFGFRLHPILGIWKGHTGVDIGVPSGSNIVAAASGTVIMAEWYGGYGYAVVIDHGSGISTLYGHNSRLLVSAGDKVSKGETIAISGSTGWSTGPHSHFEVRVNGNYVDPMTYFN